MAVDDQGKVEAETAFVRRLLARDEAAFNELVELYQARVLGLVYRMLGRRDEAEDVTQEVFVQVFKRLDQFRGDAKLSTWIFRIAVNMCKNRIKYNARRAAGKQDDFNKLSDRSQLGEGQALNMGRVERPDEMVEGIRLERIVKEAVTRVDGGFREVLILRDVEDLSYDEIASVTGLPTGTIKSRIHRGRVQLRAEVERMLGEKLSKGKK